MLSTRSLTKLFICISLLAAALVIASASERSAVGETAGYAQNTSPAAEQQTAGSPFNTGGAVPKAPDQEADSALDVAVQRTSPPLVRGLPGDSISDVIIGKPDFADISPETVVGHKLFWAFGTVIDRTHAGDDRMYVFDAGNNRILGIHLAYCLQHIGQCSADDPGNVILGQANNYSTGCNRDSGFQHFPDRAPASQYTLCSQPEDVGSVSEQLSGSSMAVGTTGALYVVDSHNNRVLKYTDPFSSTAASDVWGQADFTGNRCNRGASVNNNTLCFGEHLTFGVLIGQGGVDIAYRPIGIGGPDLWVADQANNRVLRFPNGGHNADIVLGQSAFNTNSAGSGLNQLSEPYAVRVSSDGTVFVADRLNNRVLRYSYPQSTGMSGAVFTTVQDVWGLELDPTRPDPSGKASLWVHNTGNCTVDLFSQLGSLMTPRIGQSGNCGNIQIVQGSMGIASPSPDGPAAGDIFFSYKINYASSDRHDVWKVRPETSPTTFTSLFSGTPYGNYLTTSGLAWAGGVVATSSQMIVGDGGQRVLYWSNPSGLASGQAASGIMYNTVGGNCCLTLEKSQNYLYVSMGTEIRVYQLPVSQTSSPVATLAYPFNTADGQMLAASAGTAFWGIAPAGDDSYLWLSDSYANRVFRVRNPLSPGTRVVDAVLGQTGIAGTSCNQGSPPNPNASLYWLCRPGLISMDKLQNLYVSDNTFEIEGNKRIIMFDNAVLNPSGGPSVLYDPPGSRTWADTMAFKTAFDSRNRMVASYSIYGFNDNNPYPTGHPEGQARFLGVYNNPLVPVANPTVLVPPDALLFDYNSQPMGLNFDDQGNLYSGDINRGRVLIYRKMETCEAVTWTNTMSVTVTGNTITATSSLGYPGAGSTLAIKSGAGYASATAGSTTGNRMFGLSSTNASHRYSDINYGLLMSSGGNLSVYELGVLKSIVGTYAASDNLEVGVDSGVVRYYKNGVLLYTSSVAPVFPLFYNAAISSVGGQITNAYLCGDTFKTVPWHWTNVSNVTPSGNSIQKTGGVDGQWDAGAASNVALLSGNGYAEATADATNKYRKIGLSTGAGGSGYSDMNYALSLDGGGTMSIWESGTWRIDLGPYNAGDIVRVAVENGAVRYYHNGKLRYTSTVTPTYPLYLDTSIANTAGQLYNVYFAGDDLSEINSDRANAADSAELVRAMLKAGGGER